MEPSRDFGRYKLLRRIAAGGMAEVYLAQAMGPAGFSKAVVIKRILPHLAEEKHVVDMFLNEARIAAQLNHPNLAQIFELGEAEGHYFITMEYIEGIDLNVMARRLRHVKAAFPIEVAVRIVSQVCEGLAYAHEFVDPVLNQPLNLVHRDVTLSNILLSFQGAVKVVDFGIAKATGHLQGTATGVLKGKIPYMSPEQLRCELIDRRSDVFSLGIVLYQMLAGVNPFNAPSEALMMQRILDTPPTPLRELRPEVPSKLVDVIERSLANNRKDRYQDCRTLQAALEDVLADLGMRVGSQDLAAFANRLVGTAADLEPSPEATPPGFSLTTSIEALDEGGGPLLVATTVADAGSLAADSRFSATLDGTAENLLVRITIAYAEHEVVLEAEPLDFSVTDQNGQKVVVRRDAESERAAIRAVEQLGLRHKAILGRFNAVGETAIEIWGRARELFPAGWKIITPQRARVTLKPRINVDAQIAMGPNGFDVELRLTTEGTLVDLTTVRVAARGNKRFVHLGKDEFVELRPELAQLDDVLTELDQGGAAFRVPLYELANIARLIGVAANRAALSDVERMLARLLRTIPPEPLAAPPSFAGVLRSYQRTGLGWLHLLRGHDLAGVLADDASLGKKVTTLAALLSAPVGPAQPHLVVTSTTALPLWMQEAARLAPTLSAGAIDARAGRSLWFATYEQLTETPTLLDGAPFDHLVLDQADLLKQMSPELLAALKTTSARYRMALTSTPVESRLRELWIIFDILMPGFLGSAEAFKARYEDPIDRDGDDHVRKRLRDRIQPFVLRRLKREVLPDHSGRHGTAKIA